MPIVLAFPGVSKAGWDLCAIVLNEAMEIALAEASAEFEEHELHYEYTMPVPFDVCIAPEVVDYAFLPDLNVVEKRRFA